MPLDSSIYALQKPTPSPLETITEISKAKIAQQTQQANALKLQAAQREQAATAFIGKALTSGVINADGTVNLEKARAAVMENPDAALAWPKIEKSFYDARESGMKVAKAQAEVNQLEAQQMDQLATHAADVPDGELPGWLATHLIALGEQGAIEKDHVRQTLAQFIGPDGQPDLTATKKVLSDMRDLSAKTQKDRANAVEAEAKANQAIKEEAGTSAEGITAKDAATLAATVANQRGQLARQEQRDVAAMAHDVEMEKIAKRRADIAATAAARATQGQRSATGGARLSAAAVEKLAGLEQSLGTLASLEGLVKDEWLGPIAGRMNAARLTVPGVDVPDDLARFAAETATLQNAVIKAITGAQMSEPEAARIKRQIPDWTDKPNVWRQKANATRDNLKTLRDKTIELARGTVAEPTTAPAGSDAYEQYLKRTKK